MAWPEIDPARDSETLAALHLFSQVVGKAATAALPWRNHGWHLTLRLHPRGMRTEPIHLDGGGAVELDLDIAGDALRIADDGGRVAQVDLRPMSVADFFAETRGALAGLGHSIAIDGCPNEVDPAIPFADDDRMRGYDGDSARRVHGALLAADRVLRQFRSGFLGKASPVHFFWGSFDLAVTRFSGRAAPLHPGGIPNLPDRVTREAYSHEVSSAGFWPGGAMAGAPFFYSYAYPAPAGFAGAAVHPAEARWDARLGEFVLDYDVVRRDGDAALLAFLESTYAAAADLAGWDRAALDCDPGVPRVPRAVP